MESMFLMNRATEKEEDITPINVIVSSRQKCKIPQGKTGAPFVPSRGSRAGNIPTVWPSSIQWSHSSAALRHDNNKHGDLAVGPTFWRFVDVCYSVWTFSNKPAIITGVVPNSRNVSRATRSPIKPFPVFNFTPCMSLPLLALFWVCIPL